MNDPRASIELYEFNRRELSDALRDAGGNSDFILSTHRELLISLALNNIEVKAQCKSPVPQVEVAK